MCLATFLQLTPEGMHLIPLPFADDVRAPERHAPVVRIPLNDNYTPQRLTIVASMHAELLAQCAKLHEL